jgi:hypothetical protein
MSETISKSTLYRVLRFLLHFGFWVGLAASVVCLVLLAVNPNFILSSGLCFDGFILANTATLSKDTFSPLFCIATMLTFLIGVFCIWILKNLVDSIRYGSPFTLKNVKRIRIIGWALLILIYLRQTANYMLAESIYNSLQKGGMPLILQPRFTLIPEAAALALGVLILAEVFRFGCTLQREHDTTV